MIKAFLASFLLVILAVVVNVATGAEAQNKPDAVPGQYIVVLKDDVTSPRDVASEMAKSHGLSPEHVYETALKGFSATIPAARLEKVKQDPRVEFVSEDNVVTTAAQTLPTGINRVDAELNSNTGTGIGVAVIDTGIDLKHPDLKSNLLGGKNCVKTFRNPNDDNGHGTHVAGTVAALSNTQGVVGVASQAKLIPVKVLSAAGSGTWSQVICGIDYVTANTSRYNIKVVNMSLSGGGSSDNNCGNTNADALHKAICKSRDAGITYVVAAGNSGANSSGNVPAAYDDAVITVSALNDSDGQAGGIGLANAYGADDTFPSWSNYGSVVDLAAPGVNIFSTWRSSSYKTISGTSMAAPHVSAAAALYIKSNPGATWIQVKNGLTAAAEALGGGHTDPSGLHPEPVLKANSL